jgi:hypothetical protein
VKAAFDCQNKMPFRQAVPIEQFIKACSSVDFLTAFRQSCATVAVVMNLEWKTIIRIRNAIRGGSRLPDLNRLDEKIPFPFRQSDGKPLISRYLRNPPAHQRVFLNTVRLLRYWFE